LAPVERRRAVPDERSFDVTFGYEGVRSMSQEKFPARIRYEYVHAPDASLHYAHGVWGGINPQGEIEINFYVEGDKMPDFSERLIAPDGSFGHEIAQGDASVRTIVRHVHSKVVVSHQTARALMDWLEDKIDALEAEERGPSLPPFEDAGSGGFHQ
jgi:hypothetical protein